MAATGVCDYAILMAAGEHRTHSHRVPLELTMQVAVVWVTNFRSFPGPMDSTFETSLVSAGVEPFQMYR